MNPKQKQGIALVLCLCALALFSLIPIANAYHGRELENKYPKLPLAPELTSHTPLPDLIAYLFVFFIFISGLIAFGMIVYAGFLYMTSGAVPSMRAEAKKRLMNTLQGLALLFGIYLLLNIINPEFVQPYTPGEGPVAGKSISLEEPIPRIGVTVDLATLKYGGVVVFKENDWPGGDQTCGVGLSGTRKAIEGICEESDTIFTDIQDFNLQSYLGDGGAPANTSISSIKILGDCTIVLEDISSTRSSPLSGPANIILDSDGRGRLGVSIPPGLQSFADNVRGIFFEPRGNTCVGHSITVFRERSYNISPSAPKDTSPFPKGSLAFIDSDADLSDRDFVAHLAKIEDNIRSVKFAKITTPAPDVTFCAMREFQTGEEGCQKISNSTSTLERNPIEDKISSIRFDTNKFRQAGVVMYEDPNFNARQEIFIASDKNLNPSFVQNDKISSIKIIGQYKVTLYSNEDFATDENYVVLDNSNPADPQITVSYDSGRAAVTTNLRDNGLKSGGNVLTVEDFRENIFCVQFATPTDPNSDCTATINDKVSSIKIETLKTINDDQSLGGDCSAGNGFCVL